MLIQPFSEFAKIAFSCSLDDEKLHFCAVWKVKICIFVQFNYDLFV